MKILICGQKSFAATGLLEILCNYGHEVDCFSRGDLSRNGPSVSGDVLSLSDNPLLGVHYDVVINFILLKNQGVEANLAYIKELVCFCKQRYVQTLIQISSISVYPNDESYVDETTPIEKRTGAKGPYASVKVSVDQYLAGLHDKTFKVAFIRPGFIVTEGQVNSLSGIIFRLLPGVGILLGSKRTPLPLLERSMFHCALAKVIQQNDLTDVYLMFSNKGATKYELARRLFKGPIVVVPSWIVQTAAGVARCCRIITNQQYHQLVGLYKTTRFDSRLTEAKLKVKFDL